MTDAVPERSFRYLSNLLERYSGQELAANRYWRVETALAPIMRVHAIADLPSLVSILSAGTNRVLERQIVEAMLNNETSFFRDQAAFSLLTGPALNSLREARTVTRRLRIWSAACSTGQEVYSLAMALIEDRAKWVDWDIQIVGSDVSTQAVERAREGRYSQMEIQRGMPIAMMLRYFEKDGDDWLAKPELRSMLSFRKQNLLEPLDQPMQFDMVLCRNAIMYLQPHYRTTVFENLARAMRNDGFLMLGAAETVIGQTEQFHASKDYRGLYERAARTDVRSAA